MRFAKPFAGQTDALLLIGDVLGMGERKVEKAPHAFGNFEIEPARHRLARNSPRHFVGRKGLGFAPEHIARKLVEEKDEGQRAFSAAAPGLKRSPAPCPPGFFETQAN